MLCWLSALSVRISAPSSNAWWQLASVLGCMLNSADKKKKIKKNNSVDTRPGFICIASIWPDSLRAVTKTITQIKTQMGPQYHFIQGTVRRGFVSNRHGVLEFSSCGAPGRPPFRLNGSFCLQCATVIDHVVFPAQKYRIVAVVFSVSRQLPGPGPGAPGPPHTCPRWGPDW